jgi:hypothetical protein
MPTAYRIFLESREAYGDGVSGAGHLYLVLRQVDVDSNSNSYNFVSDRTIGGNSSAVSQRLITAENSLLDSPDGYEFGVTPSDRHSQDITAWLLGIPNINGEANDAVILR